MTESPITPDPRVLEAEASQQVLRLYDNTRISDWRRCGRYFYFRHVRDWTPDKKSAALIFGGSWHEAMDVIWAGYATTGKKEVNNLIDKAHDAFVEHWVKSGMQHPDEISADDLEYLGARTPGVAKEMIYEYWDARQHIFKDPSFSIIEIERPFAVPLDPNDLSLWYVGRLDKTFKFRGHTIIGEHKTTTSYKKDGPFRSDFLDSFTPNSQIDGYLYAGHNIYGKNMQGIWVDAALVHKSIHDGFEFIPIERMLPQLDAWLWETHYYLDQIEGNLSVLAERAVANVDYLAAFPKNTGSCSNFGGCPYSDVCRAVANPATLEEPPLGFKKEHWSPFDELKLEKLGFTIDKTGERPNETPAGDDA